MHSIHKLVKHTSKILKINGNLENLEFRKKKKINGILGWLKSSKALIMVGNSFLQVNLEISQNYLKET